MFTQLTSIQARPQPYARYTTPALWNDPHISAQMLAAHLNPTWDAASRNTAFINRSAAWIIDHFELRPGKAVLDLGCGPGLYATRFAHSGASITGVDLSERSIEYARAKAVEDQLDVGYINANYLEDWGLDASHTFDLITLIYCDFCVLDPTQRGQLLGRIRQRLKPDGQFLLDVHSMHFFECAVEKAEYAWQPHGGFWSPASHHVFHNTFRYENERLLLDKYTVIDANSTREFFNWTQCYSLEAVQREFASHGFQVRANFANVAGDTFDATHRSDAFALIAAPTATAESKS